MAFHGLKMLSKGDVYPALKTTFMKCTCNIVEGKAFNWYLTKFKQSNGCDYNSDKNWYLFFDFSICIHFHSERPKICGNWVFPENFHTRKLGEITVFYAVLHIRLRFKYASSELFSSNTQCYPWPMFTSLSSTIVVHWESRVAPAVLSYS